MTAETPATPAETKPPMGRKKSSVPLVDVRISEEALAVARSVVGFTGETVPAYLSRVVLHQARLDRDLAYERQKEVEAKLEEKEPE